MSYVDVLGDKSATYIRARVLDYIVSISFVHILYSVYFNVYCGCFNLFCNVWGFYNVWVCVCVGFVMCGCFGTMYTCIYCVLYCLYCVCCVVSFMYIYSYLFGLY